MVEDKFVCKKIAKIQLKPKKSALKLVSGRNGVFIWDQNGEISYLDLTEISEQAAIHISTHKITNTTCETALMKGVRLPTGSTFLSILTGSRELRVFESVGSPKASGGGVDLGNLKVVL